MAYPRVNTLKLVFKELTEKPTILQLHQFIRDSLQLTLGDVMSLEVDFIKKEIFLKLKDGEKCESILQHTQGVLEYEDSTGRYQLPIQLADKVIIPVRVSIVPMELPQKLLVQHLQDFGEVIRVNEEKYSDVLPFPIRTGKMIVHMTAIKKNIPSYITVAGYRLFVVYTGQQPTCGFCASMFHKYAECEKRPPPRRALPENAVWGKGSTVIHPVTSGEQSQKAQNDYYQAFPLAFSKARQETIAQLQNVNKSGADFLPPFMKKPIPTDQRNRNKDQLPPEPVPDESATETESVYGTDREEEPTPEKTDNQQACAIGHLTGTESSDNLDQVQQPNQVGELYNDKEQTKLKLKDLPQELSNSEHTVGDKINENENNQLNPVSKQKWSCESEVQGDVNMSGIATVVHESSSMLVTGQSQPLNQTTGKTGENDKQRVLSDSEESERSLNQFTQVTPNRRKSSRTKKPRTDRFLSGSDRD